eukprot:scaffold70637_cov65-Phaeocystis_antarctica.AAC.1
MPFRSDLTSAVTLRSSSAAPGTEEEGGEGGEEGGGKGGEGARDLEGGGGQQSTEPQPSSKQDCWQYGPRPLESFSIHFCFEHALSNNNCTARWLGLDSFRQSPHV